MRARPGYVAVTMIVSLAAGCSTNSPDTPARMRPRRRAHPASSAASATTATVTTPSSAPVPIQVQADLPMSSPSAASALANTCTAEAHGAYTVRIQTLPISLDAQRTFLLGRMQARDPAVDVMGLDTGMVPEFATAGWTVPWTGANKSKASAAQFPVALDTGTWKNQLVALPYNTSVQQLWYRSDLVPNPPKTWRQMIAMSLALKSKKKPYYVEEQGRHYEGLTLWFNSLLATAGGSILDLSGDKVVLGRPAATALQIMHEVATTVADPGLAQSEEDDGRRAMEAGHAAFELNYPYVYPAAIDDGARVGGTPLAKILKPAPFPALVATRPAHPTVGGIDLALSPYGRHRSQAFAAALCLGSARSQEINAEQAGLQPTLRTLYQRPSSGFRRVFPYYSLLDTELQNAVTEPRTVKWQQVDEAVAQSLSPPATIDPASTLSTLTGRVSAALR